MAVAVVAVLPMGWVVWHRSAKQLAFLGAGVSALCLSSLVWRHGLLPFAWDPGERGQRLSAARAKRGVPEGWTVSAVVLVASLLPPPIVASVVALVGLGLILAATSTGVGSTLAPAATSAYVVLDFIGALSWVLPSLLWLGVSIGLLFYRPGRLAGVLGLGAVAFVTLIGFMWWSTPGMAHDIFDYRVFGPFREMWRLLHR